MSSYQNLGRESNSKNAASPSSPQPEHAGVQILSPDRGGIEKFVNAMFRHVGSEGFVSLRSFYDDRNERFRILAVSLKGGLEFLSEAAADEAYRAANNGTRPVVFAPPISVFLTGDNAKQENLLKGPALSVECDQRPQEAVAALEKILGPATVVVRSGGLWTDPATGEIFDKLHIHYRLSKPAQGEALVRLKHARVLATGIVGGDASNKPIVHPIRWPGSWHRKNAPKLCKIESLNPELEIDLDTAIASLEAAAATMGSKQKESKEGKKAGNGTSGEGDWGLLIGEVLTSKSFHEPLVRLAMKLLVAGLKDAAAVNFLRGLMKSAAGPRDDRWQARHDDIPRAVSTAREKIGGETAAGAEAKTETSAPSEAPRPLMRKMPPADPFPIDALGHVLGPAARAIHDRVQAPLAVCAQSVLGTAMLVTQAYANVELPIGGKRVKPISSYLITIAESGERKTEADFQASWAIRKFEESLREKHDAAKLSYMNDKLAWEKARKELTKKFKGNRAATKQALDELGPPPAAPLAPMLTSTEPTLEGLIKQFPDHRPSLGIYSSEGGQFIGGHEMGEENKLKSAAGLSALWDGEPVRRVRAGDGAAIFSGRRLSVHLMVQPEVASILFQDRLLAGQGLHSRLLVSAPESTAGKRQPKPEKHGTALALEKYGNCMLAILQTPLPLKKDRANEPDPKTHHFSQAAIERWTKFVGHGEARRGAGGGLEPMPGPANKLPAHAARLAAVTTLASDIHAIAIDDARVKAGITLAEHYAGEALRVFEASKVNADLVLAQQLLDWLHRPWPEQAISLHD